MFRCSWYRYYTHNGILIVKMITLINLINKACTTYIYTYFFTLHVRAIVINLLITDIHHTLMCANLEVYSGTSDYIFQTSIAIFK